MSSRPDLKLAWCSRKAAKYAVEHWHYSRCMPAGKLILVGVWECETFIGAIMYGRGATPNLGKPYGLQQTECVELVRIALKSHQTPVSRMIAIAGRMIACHNPGIRLVVSFADSSQGHHGGIYQANGWMYAGRTGAATFYRIHGKMTHPRSIGAKGFVQNIGGARRIDPRAVAVKVPGKYRYLMPLDAEMRKQIEPLRKPYPKRAGSDTGDTPTVQVGKGGPIPTSAL